MMSLLIIQVKPALLVILCCHFATHLQLAVGVWLVLGKISGLWLCDYSTEKHQHKQKLHNMRYKLHL